MKPKFSVFLLVFLVVSLVASMPFVPTVQAQETKTFGKDMLPNWLNVTVIEDSDFVIVDNNDGFVYKFRLGTTGYNEIWENNSQIVANEQWVLQYLAQSKWKQRGIPQHVSWEQPESYHVIVKRFYDDFLGTTFNITYSFHGGFRPKIAFEGFIGQEDDYRIKWAISGINKTYVTEKATSVEFWNEDEIPIVFDYEDVYNRFGDITSIELDPWANNHKLNEVFFIGILSIEYFTLDPTFGKTDIGSSNTNDFQSWEKIATRFQAPADGNITEISWYGRAQTAQDFTTVVYNDTNNEPYELLGNSSIVFVGTSNSWWNFTFSAEVTITNSEWYWLGIHAQNFNAFWYYYDAGATNQTQIDNIDAPPADNPWADIDVKRDEEMSIYATYTVSAPTENFYGSISQTFGVTHEKTVSYTSYSSINQQFSVNSIKEITFPVYGAVNPTFTVNSITQFLRTIDLSGTINQVFTVDFIKAFSFTIFSAVNPTFTVESTTEFIIGQILNFFGSISQTFTLEHFKTVSFTLFSSIGQTFTIEGATEFLTNILNFFGNITQAFTISGWTDLTPPIPPITYATEDFVLSMMILAIGVLMPFVVAFDSIKRKRRQRSEAYS